jgi:hypothetical protein
LAIVERHVARLGGKLSLSLPAEGGLRATVWLPSD